MDQWYKCPKCNQNILFATDLCPFCKCSLAWSRQGPILQLQPFRTHPQTGQLPVEASQQQLVQWAKLIEKGFTFSNQDLLFISDKDPNDISVGTYINITISFSDGGIKFNNNENDDPSTIFLKLPIKKPTKAEDVEPPGYYPSYATLSPEQRWVYLNWLQNVIDEVNISFVFIYYYGLERILLTGIFDRAFDEILKLRRYHRNNSFLAYSESSLLNSSLLMNRPDKIMELLQTSELSDFSASMFLIAYGNKYNLSAANLMSIYDKMPGLNKKYFHENRQQFQNLLTAILVERFTIDFFPFARNYDFREAKYARYPLFANYSLPDNVRAPDLPNFYTHIRLMNDLTNVFEITNQKFKTWKMENRKALNLTPVGTSQQLVVPPVEVSQTSQTIIPSNAEHLDLRKAECPYCHAPLKKTPGSKTKCPHCGKYMRVKTRPSDHARVVVTEEESDKIDEEWSMVSGIHNGFVADKERIEEEREILKMIFGKEPSERDLKWAILNRNLIEQAQHGDWGLYRNTRFYMAEILRKEMKLEQAMQTYLEICYLDINGPNNLGGVNSHTILTEYPPFLPRQFDPFAPAIIDFIVQIMKYLKLYKDKVKYIFIEHNSRIEKDLKLPLSAEYSWHSLEKYI